MTCKWSNAELEEWEGCTNPMGDECYTCSDFECEHNNNPDNPDAIWTDWEKEDLAQAEIEAGPEEY